jgi:uncharacterized protein YdeI (YjbR/CyaY-like superfamily)
MELKNGIKTFHATSQKEWRKWLQKNHATEISVWLIIYKKESKVQTVYYPEAVDEALCFGWIDSKPNKRDAESYYQFFSVRNPKSNWSKVNKEKVERLLATNQMTAAGQKMIDLAKKTGTWNALDEVEEAAVPIDLQKQFDKNKTALKNWSAFPPSTRKGILQWILNAKLPATRQKRIDETVGLAAKNVRANQYVPKKS